jgi:hypothetical protein
VIGAQDPCASREPPAPVPDPPPPILGRWANLYALVIVVLLTIIAALSWLTRRFS